MKLLKTIRFTRQVRRLLSSNPLRSTTYIAGDVIHGYEVKRVAEIPEFSMTAIELEHSRTGSSHLHLARNDNNNVFNVLLRTTPMNSTGVAHVLEHVALCGSHKFPVRDPFFKMLNRSMSSFMNALTGSDYTMYPFSTKHSIMVGDSKLSKDFKNLLAVYLDSVFFPRIRKMDFLQEGWRLEHENLDDDSSPIVFKGVVYNEMKGLMADAHYLYGTAIQNHLLPDHTYAVCSGGRPADIPSLTWEDLKDFHASHYHPSNARFITYGDLPLEDHLEQINKQVMQKFERFNPDTSVPAQTVWREPRHASLTCPPDAMAANPDKQTTFSVNYLLPEVSNVFERTVASVLCTLLTDGPASPFYKSLIESGLGSEYSPNTGYHDHTREGLFSIGLQGISADDEGKIEDIIKRTINDVIEEGFSDQRVESILHRIELQTKHQSSKFGLGLTFNIMPTWQHGADPVESLQVNNIIKKFRMMMKDDPDFLKKKCKEYFKTNNHLLSLTMSPDQDYSKKTEAVEQKNLQAHIRDLSLQDKQEILKQGKELLRNQHAKEDLSCLPTLHVEDIPKTGEKYEVQSGLWLLLDNPHTIVTSEQPTNGVTYFENVIPIDELREDLKPYVPLFCYILPQLGTSSTDYVTFSEREDLCTGGLSAFVESSAVFEPMVTETFVRLQSHCLERNTETMFELWQELFHEWNINDDNRLRTLIRQLAQNLANGVSFRGHMYAIKSAAQYLTPANYYEETFSGLSQIKLMQKLAESENILDVKEKLREIGDFILRKHVLTHAQGSNGRSMLHATPSFMSRGKEFLDEFVQGKPDKEANRSLLSDLLDRSELEYVATEGGAINRPVMWKTFQDHVPSKKKIFHELPMQVNFTSLCLPTPYTYVSERNPVLRIMARLLTTEYLHREIREKGGAYGGGAKHGFDGVFRFYSYRDPNNLRTIEKFSEGLKWLASGSFSIQHVDEAKLAVFQAVDAPMSPCNRGLDFFLHGLTDEMRQTHREQLLAVHKDDLVQAAETLMNVDCSGVAVIGPDSKQFRNSEWFRAS